MNSSNLPLVGVSACLLGQRVRYDGQSKYNSVIVEELKKSCQIIAVCPEVEIGLGTPRAKIQLTQVGSIIKVLKTDDPNIDVSQLLTNFAKQFISKHRLSGLVLQDRSPSCGIDNVKLFSKKGLQIGLSSGLFAKTIIDLMPGLVVIQASEIQNTNDIKKFINKLPHGHVRTNFNKGIAD